MAPEMKAVSPVRQPPVAEEDYPRPDVDACWLSMKMILNRTRHLFLCRGTLTDESNDKDLGRIKTIFRKSQKEHETRHWLGTSEDLWADYAECFEEIVVQLQEQYQLPDVPGPNEKSFTTLVLSHSSILLKDFERLNDLLLLARNMLAGDPRAQELAVLEEFHQQVYQLMQICIEFNNEGFAGEAGSLNETIFTKVINQSKALLVTCMQFIYNLAARNDAIKMQVWLDLLCEGSDLIIPDVGVKEDDEESLRLSAINHLAVLEQADSDLPDNQVADTARKLLGPFANAQSGSALRSVMTFWRRFGLEISILNLRLIGFVDDSSTIPAGSQYRQMLTPPYAKRRREQLDIGKALGKITAAKHALVAPLGAEFPIEEEGDLYEGEEKDDGFGFHAHTYPPERDLSVAKEFPTSPYALSEIPIILGPNEIEALPLMLQSCILATKDITALSEQKRVEQAVRCHFLLRTPTGRMLLRELYIFIAAWDLPDDELFYKAMVNITDSFLQHGLLADAYDALVDPKDIVSPAQNVLVKLILHIFKLETDPPERYTLRSLAHQSLDVAAIRFLLQTFRSAILPRALAIIWMQGQVRDQLATAEDFERANLNLWDMERTYEGVYQFLELFSALNDNPVWKAECVRLEIAWDIVELIRYLHKYIPIQPLVRRGSDGAPLHLAFQAANSSTAAVSANATSTATTTASTPAAPTLPQGQQPVSVERPYSPSPNPASANAATSTSASIPAPPPLQTPAGTAEPALQQQPPPQSPRPSSPNTPQPPHSYPWRNLKKMSILVLSGLLYNTPSLRAQIRSYDGVLLVASCSEHDENNPYIKEHAVLCLKLLLEGDRENQRLVEELKAREVRGLGGLEGLGYRAGLDDRGRVRVWRFGQDKEKGNAGQVVEVENEAEGSVTADGKGTEVMDERAKEVDEGEGIRLDGIA